MNFDEYKQSINKNPLFAEAMSCLASLEEVGDKNAFTDKIIEVLFKRFVVNQKRKL